MNNAKIMEKDPLQPNGPPQTTLVEIGPRFVLTPIKIFEGAFGGATVFSNPGTRHIVLSRHDLLNAGLTHRVRIAGRCAHRNEKREGREIQCQKGRGAGYSTQTRDEKAGGGRACGIQGIRIKCLLYTLGEQSLCDLSATYDVITKGDLIWLNLSHSMALLLNMACPLSPLLCPFSFSPHVSFSHHTSSAQCSPNVR